VGAWLPQEIQAAAVLSEAKKRVVDTHADCSPLLPRPSIALPGGEATHQWLIPFFGATVDDDPAFYALSSPKLAAASFISGGGQLDGLTARWGGDGSACWNTW
jgi:hypothetical protein